MNGIADMVGMVLAAVLVVAAGRKVWQLLTEPSTNTDIWSYRRFPIFEVEFEPTPAIWLLCGLFQKAAWLAAMSCFCVVFVYSFI
ncbi:MAG: hypothetical protein ACYTEX_11970 [Planctomycetota bacterium]|jgi:hypothetical protein